MKKEVWLGKRNLRFYFYRYKDSPYYSLAIWITVIVVCLLLLFNVIIPQFNNWFSIRKEVQATQEKIARIKKNINYMNNVDESLLNSQFEIASRALPPEGDLEGILNALSDAAVTSSVSFDDFSFRLGSVNAEKRRDATGYKDASIIQISLVIHGPLSHVKRFLQEIAVKVPISEVSYVNGSGDVVSLHIQFYEKPFPQIVLKSDEPIVDISDKNRDLLQKLAAWKSGQPHIFAPQLQEQPEASTAGTPLF